jgi:hypothetical protein
VADEQVREKRKGTYSKSAAGKARKQWEIVQRRRAVALLLDQGIEQKEISRQLGVSAATVSGDVAALREAAGPLIRAVTEGRGGSYQMLFSRQSGKDETIAQVLAYLMLRYRLDGRGVVMGTPTFRPQALVSRRRLMDRMKTPLHKGAGLAQEYSVACGTSGVSFLSTDPKANARGETVDLALMVNEAQDVDPGHFDAVLAPMAASTNAPLVTAGTSWSDTSLLARERRITREMGTLYEADCRRVAEEVPAYGEYVKGQIAKLGEGHPFIRTEYCLEELGAEGGLFPERRRAQMRGEHKRRSTREDFT